MKNNKLHNRTLFLYCLVFIFSVHFSSFSQQQKDFLFAAETLSHLNDWCSANAAYSTAEINAEQPPTKCNASALRFAKWFKFKATTSSIEIKVKIGNTEGTMKFPYIILRDESLNELACVQYNDELEDIVLNYSELKEGKFYYFSVNNHNNSKYTGTFTLCLTDVESNDFAVGAIKLWSLDNWCSDNAEFTTVGGTPDGKMSSCIPQGPNFNKWFIFQAVNSEIEILAKTGAQFGTSKFPIMTLWDENFKELSCNKYVTFVEEATIKYNQLKTGNVYYISVDHIYNDKYPGTFTLCANQSFKKNPTDVNAVSITGKLYQKTGPVSSGKIFLMDEKEMVINSTLTDSKGKFHFQNLSPEKSYIVKMESDDPKLAADIFLVNGKGDILKKTIRDKKIFRFEELPPNCNSISLIDCDNPDIKVEQGKVGIMGKMLSKKDPVDAVVKQRVYLMNNPQKIVDSTFTDVSGKFQFINLSANESYLLKMGEPIEENYTEVAMINDKGKAIMTASSKNMDSKGFFRFEKLPAMEPEPMKLQNANDERIDLSSLTDGKQMDENKIIVLNNIYFDFNEYKLLEKSFDELNILVKLMNEKSSFKIEISGHTDNSGNEVNNISLSENRAKSVVDFLVSKGVGKTRLSYKGLGSSKPVVANDSEENRKKNRRVEFRIMK